MSEVFTSCLGLTELKYGMSGINVYFFLLTCSKEIKACCGQCRQSNCSLQSKADNNQRFHTILHKSSRQKWCAIVKYRDRGHIKSPERVVVHTWAAVPSLKLELTDGSGAVVSHKFSKSSGGRPSLTQTVFAGPPTSSLIIDWNMVG